MQHICHLLEGSPWCWAQLMCCWWASQSLVWGQLHQLNQLLWKSVYIYRLKIIGCSLLNHFLLHALGLVWIFWYFFTSACHSRFFSDTEVSIWQFGLHSVTLLFSLGFSWVTHTCKADLDCSQKLAQRTLSTGKHRTVKQAADLRIRRGIEHLCYDELALHALRWMC